MRTETEVDNNPVFAVWMKGAVPYIEETSNIISAVKKVKWENYQLKENFYLQEVMMTVLLQMLQCV